MKQVNSIEPPGRGDEIEEVGEQQPLLSDHSGQHYQYGVDSLTVNNFSFASKFNKQQPVMVNPTTQDARSILPLSSSSSLPSPLFYNHIRINPDNGTQRGFGKFISFKKLLQFTGPGLLISVAYLDPGNLDVDIQSGAIAGYKLLWVLMYSSIAGYLIQYLSVKLGSVTGYHLAEICHREYSPFMRLFLWIMLEISIIASDIQQVIGSALALNILTSGYIPMWGAILITTLDVLIFLLFETKGIRVIEIIFAAFISVLGCSFLYMYIRVGPDQVKILEGIAIPWCTDCSGAEIKQLIGILGSIVMPHNIYFHSCLVLSRDFERSDQAVREAKKYYAIESGFALLLAFIINLFVTSVSAKSFNGTPEAQNVTIFNTADFISSQYGMAAKIIWAIGLLSAGQCSTISGTYAGQFIMQGLTRINLTKLMRILVTRLISIVPCLLVTILAYDDIAHLSLWCNIISSIQLPFALLPILHFTSSKRIMGPFKNNLLTRIVCYLITLGILSLNIYFIIEFILKTRLLVTYILGSIFVIYSILVTIFLIGVNNVYRIKLLFRRLFCSYNPDEVDELLRTNPVYRRPERTATIVQDSGAVGDPPQASPLPLPPYLDRFRSILETSKGSTTLLRHPPSINDDDQGSYNPII